jgi:sensor histidine kinase regulating citrate/malate metabolism
MPENVDNLILQQLLGIRNDVGSMRAETHDSLKEVKARLTTLEGLVAGGRRDNALVQEDVNQQQSLIDRITDRLDRIERRLELRDEL